MADKEVRKLAAIMFTDIEGYTAFVQKDESAALKKVATHRHYLEQFTKEYNGKIIEFYGDGSLSVYESALDAVHCGIAMQKAYRTDHPIPVRVGIHVGDIVFKEGTVFGDGVNIASRLQTSGIPGSVYISDRVKAELANHPEITTKSIGERKLKNVAKPVEIFVVTNDGLSVPSRSTQIPDVRKYYKYLPLILVAGIAGWYLNKVIQEKFFQLPFIEESISVPSFANGTGDPSFEHVSEMAAHWITKELSATADAHVVSSEAASEMIQLAGISLGEKEGRSKYAALTGAVNVVDGSFIVYGTHHDSMLMSGYIRNLQTGSVLQAIDDVKCTSANPMDCIEAMASNIKGYWASRDDYILTPPNYEAYKAFLLAKKAWRSEDTQYVFEQMKKAISLDPDFIDPYFLMLNFFYNEGRHQEAQDTMQSIRKKFTDLDERNANILEYHSADIEGKNKEAYRLFLKEYQKAPKDLFTNNTAMIMSLDYVHNPRAALRFFDDIPFDSLPVNGCLYCSERLEWAMCAALELDSMTLADKLAVKLNNALVTRRSYGMLIMYWIWKKDTTKINELLFAAEHHTNLNREWQYLTLLSSRYLLLRGNPELSSHYAQKAIEVYLPKKGRYLGYAYYLNGQYDKALAVYKEERKKQPEEVAVLAEMGMVYARQGDKENAIKIISDLETMRKPFDYGVIEYFQGRIYALLGDYEKATNLFATSLQRGKKLEFWHTFSHDPDLIGMKEFPEYKQLLESFK